MKVGLNAPSIASVKIMMDSLTRPEARLLLTAGGHSLAVSRERFGFVRARVQQVSVVFSVLTILWIAMDAITISWPLWGQLAVLRAAASLAFLATAMRPTKGWLGKTVFAQLAPLFAVPVVFFLLSNLMLSDSHRQASLAASTAYHYLPFIVAAGLSLFPLTVLESAVIAGAIFGAMAVAALLWPAVVDGQSLMMTLWRLVVIAGIGVLASSSQLLFLMQLTDQSTRDGLTGLLGRRVGAEILESQFAYAERHNLPLSLLFFDLDDFKSVNDAFGHPAGDDVLREVARSLKKSFRGQESVIRWGGEEFVVALPSTDMTSAVASVQRLALLGIGRRPDGKALTASIGIAERKADGIKRPQDLSYLADQRMYMAKRAGRNRYQADGPSNLWLSPKNQQG